jgi:hypothetical protein
MDYSLVTDMFWKWQWDELRDNIGRLQKLGKKFNDQQ